MIPNPFALFAVLIIVVIGLVLELENELAVGLVPVREKRSK
jgi:hypothetical protein